MSTEAAQREARELLLAPLPAVEKSPNSDTPATRGGLRFVSAAELRTTTPPEPDWLLNDYLAHGAVTLAAGKPKSGKSTLVWALTEAVATGAPTFLGRRVTGGPVVYLSEEGAGTLVHKLPATDRIRVLTRDSAWPKPTWETLIAEAITEAQRVKAVLLVIDSLSFWAAFAEGQEKDAGATQIVMDTLGQATGAGLAVLVIHHQRKGGGEDGDAVRGSNAIFAVVDMLLELERPGGEDTPAGQRQLVATGRFPRTPPVLLVDRDPTTGAWRVVGEAAGRGAAADLGHRDRLLAATTAEAPGATSTELADLLGLDRRKIHKPLNALVGDGLIARVGEGKSGRPYRYFKTGSEDLPPKSARTLPPAGADMGSDVCPSPIGGQTQTLRSAPSVHSGQTSPRPPADTSDDEQRAEQLAARYPEQAS